MCIIYLGGFAVSYTDFLRKEGPDIQVHGENKALVLTRNLQTPVELIGVAPSLPYDTAIVGDFTLLPPTSMHVRSR